MVIEVRNTKVGCVRSAAVCRRCGVHGPLVDGGGDAGSNAAVAAALDVGWTERDEWVRRSTWTTHCHCPNCPE